jgi:uncharacterized membrane protein YfcA
MLLCASHEKGALSLPQQRNLESFCVTLPDYPTTFWVTAVFAMILIGVSKAGFGGGVAAIATPLMALTISVTDAAAILLPILIVADLFSLRHYWNVYDRRSLTLMVPGAIVGIALGAFFFGYFSDNERTLKVILGIISLLFVAYQVTRSLLLGALLKSKPSALAGVLLGGAAGFTSTLAHAGGPPATIYLLPQQLPRQLFVGTNVIFFFILNLVKLVPYGALGLLRVGNVSTILLLAPLTFLGVQLGVWLNRHFSDRWFTYIIYAMLLLTGLELVSGRSVIHLFVP